MKKGKKRSVGRPGEHSAVNIKEQILKAYFEICWNEGIEAVTLQKVADRSEVALATVRYHFQLQGLSLSQVAMDYVSDKTYEYIDSRMLHARSLSDFNPVKSYIEIMFDWLVEQPLQASFLVYYYYLCTTQAPTQISNKELVEIAQRRILGLIHEGLGMKLYSDGTDSVLLSRQIHLLVMGGCMISSTARDRAFSLLQKEICLQLCAQLLGAKNW